MHIFLIGMMNHPQFTRNVSIVGSLHSGKTMFMDILVKSVRDTRSQKDRDSSIRMRKGGSVGDSLWDGFKQDRQILKKYTDTRLDERERGLSLKSVAVSYVLESSMNKHYLLNLLDTPGHSNFYDEVLIANRVCDGVVVVVDSVMGVSEDLRKKLDSLVKQEGFSPGNLILVISQIDRLILELRLPPNDAYLKIRHMIAEINMHVAKLHVPQPDAASEESHVSQPVFSPVIGNVLFASGEFGFCFSLNSFAQTMYEDMDPELLWGDVYRCADGSISSVRAGNRTFVEYVLEPLYKIIGYCVSESSENLENLLGELGVFLPKSAYTQNANDLVKNVCGILFGGPSAIVDSISRFVPNPVDGGHRKSQLFYTGDQQKMGDEHDALLSVMCVKSIHQKSCTEFDVLARVMAGRISVGDKVFVAENDDLPEMHVVEEIFIPGGRYYVNVDSASAGNLCVLRGPRIRKFATLYTQPSDAPGGSILYVSPHVDSCIKIACEPLLPTELPKMVEGLRRIERAYFGAHTRVEESGEHVIIGSGELYMDCILHDLRKLYGDLEIKLSDPTVVFSETVSETSQYQCAAASPNKMNAVTFIAEPATIPPLTKNIINKEEFFLSKKFKKERTNLLLNEWKWDALSARSLWAFGPSWDHGTSVLFNDVISPLVPKTTLNSVRESVVEGFQWATREGPLVEETVRNCRLKMLDVFVSDPAMCGSGQIVPAACRAVYGSILTAAPKLMEPIYLVEIDCFPAHIPAIYNVLSRRRGHVLRDFPKPATPLTTIIAHVPGIELFGFETTIRLHTNGQAFGTSWFDHWAIVPGDPLDVNATTPPLEPAITQSLARDFLLKTRRRKGLGDEIHLNKYIDDVIGMGLVHEPAEAAEEAYY